MRKPGQISIDDLYFGIVLEDPDAKGDVFLRNANLFDSRRVKWSVAYWVTSDTKFKEENDLIRWCFGDVWSRSQYEFVVCPWGGLDADDKVVDVGQKVDTYRMYVEPNERLLKQMVGSVSVASAKRYLATERKKRRKVNAKV